MTHVWKCPGCGKWFVIEDGDARDMQQTSHECERYVRWVEKLLFEEQCRVQNPEVERRAK